MLTFFGVHIDCVARVLSLPASKLSQFKILLASWQFKEKVTKKPLQSLLGKLNWASRVVLGAYFSSQFNQPSPKSAFIAPFYPLISSGKTGFTLVDASP